MFFLSCEPDSKNAVISFVPEVVEVPYSGGSFSLACRNENGGELIDLSFETDADWITDLRFDGERVYLKVSRNSIPERRESDVKVTAADGSASGTFKVVQAVGEPAPFDIELVNITKTGVKAAIYPRDPSMPFISLLSDSLSMVDLADPDSLFADDMRFIRQDANYYGESFERMLGMYAVPGNRDMEVTTLWPGEPYVIYAYGIDTLDVNRVTEVVKIEFNAKDVIMQNVKFDIAVTPIENNADVTYTPVDYDGFYYSQLLPDVSETATDADIKEKAVMEYINKYNYFKMFGFSDEMILTRYCKHGPATCHYVEMKGESRYAAFAFALDDEAMKCSDVSYESFITGKVEPSDNIITIDIVDVKERHVVFQFTATNDDPYRIAFMPDSLTQGMNKDGIFKMLLQEVEQIGLKAKGSHRDTLLGLTPSTDYSVYAFGYTAGVPTTELFSNSFRTKDEYVGKATPKLEYSKYYDAIEVGKRNYDYDAVAQEGHIFMPTTVSVVPEDAEVRWGFVNQVDIDAGVSDSQIVSWLMTDGERSHNGEWDVWDFPYGACIIGVAVAIDENGSRGELYKGEAITFMRENVGDPQEFLDKYPYPGGRSASMPEFRDFTEEILKARERVLNTKYIIESAEQSDYEKTNNIIRNPYCKINR